MQIFAHNMGASDGHTICSHTQGTKYTKSYTGFKVSLIMETAHQMQYMLYMWFSKEKVKIK